MSVWEWIVQRPIEMTEIRFLSWLAFMVVMAPSVSFSTDKMNCSDSMISMSAPAFAQPDLRCWRNVSGDYVYDFVHAKRAGNVYNFVALANAKSDGFMNFEPNVQAIIKSATPRTYNDAGSWSDDQEVETKFATNATFAKFRAWGWNCFGFVQYHLPKHAGYKFLLSGVNCEDLRGIINPEDVAGFINQFDFSE